MFDLYAESVGKGVTTTHTLNGAIWKHWYEPVERGVQYVSSITTPEGVTTVTKGSTITYPKTENKKKRGWFCW